MAYLITKSGYLKLKEELRFLIEVERPRTIELLENSRVIGDAQLEDSDYIVACSERDMIEERIDRLTRLIDEARPVDLKTHYDTVEFGAIIEIEDCDTLKRNKYRIVSAVESNPSEGTISIEAPIVKQFIGGSIGDYAEFNGKEYELISIC